MKKILIVALSLIGLICAGCFKAEFDLTVTATGAVNRHWKIMGTAPFARQIEEIKSANERLYSDLTVKPIAEGDMLGYEFALTYPDIETFARSPGEMYSAHAGKNRGISRRKGWFFDEYDFDFYAEYSRASLPPEAEFITQSAFNDVAYDVTIRLPHRVEAHNADTVTGDGRYLSWNLAPILIHGGERHMNARFKLWHADKAALTAIIELMLLAATIFFFRKARTEESEGVAKDLRFKRNVFAGLSVALAIVATCLLIPNPYLQFKSRCDKLRQLDKKFQGGV